MIRGGSGGTIKEAERKRGEGESGPAPESSCGREREEGRVGVGGGVEGRGGDERGLSGGVEGEERGEEEGEVGGGEGEGNRFWFCCVLNHITKELGKNYKK